MDQKLLLNEALTFLHLTESSSEQDLKVSYHNLAKKYHPDAGEYDSDVLFQELQRHYDFLKEYLQIHHSFLSRENLISSSESLQEQRLKTSRSKREGNDPIFNQYKLAKEIETTAILSYFDKNKNSPLNLDEVANKNLEKLRKELEPARKIFLDIIGNYPQSIWASDSKDSLQRLSVWWKKDKPGENSPG